MSTTGSDPKLDVYKINEVYKKGLSIPDYQRPYKWRVENVRQLLDDLNHHCINQPNSTYRLGTLVIHKNQDKYDIVDGQQRLVTLALILHRLKDTSIDAFLEKDQFAHPISQYHIYHNYQLIKQYLGALDGNSKTSLREFIQKQCEFVWIELTNQNEAFQFFDSQNARGKSLAPYDLLKAYHLRAIPFDHPNKLDYVMRWERAIDGKPSLDQVISKTLFCLRQWSKSRRADEFTVKQLSVFKGVTLEEPYPYLNAVRANLALYQEHQANPWRMVQPSPSPFQTTQPLIDGELFFMYIDHYVQMYHRLFDKDQGALNGYFFTYGTSEVKKQISYLDAMDYDGSHRTGDGYLRILFYAMVLMYYDKFETHGLDVALSRIFNWVFQVRLDKERIDWGTIEKIVAERDGLFDVLLHAIHPKQIANFIVMPLSESKSKSVQLAEYLSAPKSSS
ncbi:DUF262 domain-containing protein [uncultured Moraxella sp.]|uniref:DUF262 domain-containing protein n=1 Tax=uncultured Moraxella sp. TaxID=263769 RepID=UPI0025E28E93|nr:DUF262 domain-containing protein [uncultured Moraxella sp.]